MADECIALVEPGKTRTPLVFLSGRRDGIAEGMGVSRARAASSFLALLTFPWVT